MSNERTAIWKMVPLRSITSKIGSGATPRGGEQAYKSSGIPLIRSMNVHFDGFRPHGLAYLDETQAAALNGVTVRAGDVLLNITGASIGRVTQAPEQMEGARVNQHVCIIRLTGDVDSRFVARYLASPSVQTFISGENYGVTRQALTKEMVENINIPLPSIGEQRRMVAKLDALLASTQRARVELARIPRLVERYKQGILAAAFRGELTAKWRRNRRIRTATAIPLEQALLQIKTGPFGSALHKSDYVSDGVPVVNPMHINDAKITASSDTSITRAKANQLSEFQLKDGDVIIARRGEMGRCAVVSKYENGWLCGTGSMILRPAPSLLPHYLQMFLSSPSTVGALEADAVGTTMVNLNQKILLSLAIPVPPVDEQAEVIVRVHKAFERMTSLAVEATRAHDLLDRLDQATLAKAFRGELVRDCTAISQQHAIEKTDNSYAY